MKTVVPISVLNAARCIETYGQSAVMILTAPDALCIYEVPAARVLSEWVLESCGAEDGVDSVAPEPATEHLFTLGYCYMMAESYGSGYQQRTILHAAWGESAIIVSNQAYPKTPPRRFTAESIPGNEYRLLEAMDWVRGSNPDRKFAAPRECRIYTDDTILYVAMEGTVWVVPNDDNSRIECFAASTFRDSWLFEGGALPSIVTSRPAAMAAFAFAGLV